jgi:hypothetical protein
VLDLQGVTDLIEKLFFGSVLISAPCWLLCLANSCCILDISGPHNDWSTTRRWVISDLFNNHKHFMGTAGHIKTE